MSAIGDLLDGPPRHLERYAPPWASGRFTICGRPLDDVSAWLTYDEGRALIAKIGETRARLLLCQTCLSMQTRIAHPRKWEADPVQIVNDYTRHFYAPGNDPAAQQIRAELLAIARLIEAHLVYSGRIQILLWDCPECGCVHWAAATSGRDKCRHCGTEVEVALP